MGSMIQDTEVRGNRYLWSICLISSMGGLLFGYDAVVMSGTIPKVIEQFNFNSFQLGFLVSCVLWGCAVGSVLGGLLLDRVGRKRMMILSALIIFGSAFWSGLASSPNQLNMARLLGGVGAGLAITTCPLYVSEVAPENSRGRLVSLYHFSVCLGIVLCVFVNWGIFSHADAYSSTATIPTFWKWLTIDQYWRAMFFSESLPGIIFLLGVFMIPESPRWLVQEGELQRADLILKRINGEARGAMIGKDILKSLQNQKQSHFSDLFSHQLRRPLTLAIFVCILSEACGITAILYYGPQLLEHSGISLGHSLGGFAIIAIVNLIFNLIAILFMDRAGRKKLLGIGATGCMLSLIAIGTLFLIGDSGLIIVVPFITFMAFFGFSVGPVKFIIISEIFPNQIRGKAVSTATIFIWLTSAVVTQLFPIMRDFIDTGYIFYFFAFDLLVLLLLDILFIHETKGKSLDEINI